MSYLYYFIALFSLSQAANLIRWAEASALVIGFWRLLGASLCMLALLIWSRRKQSFVKFARTLPAKKTLFVCGSLFFAHLWTYFYAAQNTSISAAMILFSLNPLFTALLSAKLVGDHVAPKVKWAMLLGFAGLLLLMSETSSPSAPTFWGNLSAFASALLFSGYLLSSKMARKKMDNLSFTTAIYAVCAFWFFVFMAWTETSWHPSHDHFWPAILALILFPTLLGHALFSYLLKDLNINWMSCGKLLEPGVASLVAFFAFGERPSLMAGMAFGFTAAAVLLLYSPWKKS
jgi:drug/metabolite transporter (DMT)-like permease